MTPSSPIPSTPLPPSSPPAPAAAQLSPHARNWRQHLASRLMMRQIQHLTRSLHPVASAASPEIVVDGQPFLQFSSNNYLGLADHPAVIDAAVAATQRYGAGSGSSRLVAGSFDLHHQLEEALARFKHTEAALLFPTGYMANLAALTTFADGSSRIVSDKYNHASLHDGARFSGALCRTFAHGNYARAAELLSRENRDRGSPHGGLRFLVTDTVFSMDGDVADLRAACDAADAAGALVIVDEAHATGVLGPTGAGAAEAAGVSDRITLSVGTLSKALGSLGGFIAASKDAIAVLINDARPLIYTTALPASCSAAALAALELVRAEPQRRTRVLQLAEHVRGELSAMGFNIGRSATPIIPVILGSEEATLRAAAFLKEHGIHTPAIRPPTVPSSQSRLRLSLMATHTDNHIAHLLTMLKKLRDHLHAA